MKVALYETNILLDVLLNREPFFLRSAQAMDLVGQGRIAGLISGHAIPTLSYLLAQRMTPSKSRTLISTLLTTFRVAAVTDEVIRHALSSPIRDFEDAVTHAAALKSQAEVIVTRNVRDFAKGSVPPLLPESFLTQHSLLGDA